MRRNTFTEDEVILCTYAALYSIDDLGGVESIGALTNRSLASIKMKIQNIVAMIDYEGIKRISNESPLTGLPQGQRGRRTNWELVEKLAKLSRKQLLEKCQEILKGK